MAIFMVIFSLLDDGTNIPFVKSLKKGGQATDGDSGFGELAKLG